MATGGGTKIPAWRRVRTCARMPAQIKDNHELHIHSTMSITLNVFLSLSYLLGNVYLLYHKVDSILELNCNKIVIYRTTKHFYESKLNIFGLRKISLSAIGLLILL